jgi:hypothetical protein
MRQRVPRRPNLFGKCGLQCSGGATRCGDKCVDTAIDNAHCGGCDKACPSGQVCSSGMCGLKCAGGTTLCNNKCVDTQLDPSNCGSCGTACAQNAICWKGSCVSCFDNVKNGSETDIDCGGTFCGKCRYDQSCVVNADCLSNVCYNNKCYATSCLDALYQNKSAQSGVYSILPDVNSTPFMAYCEMAADGGGWTLIMKIDGTKTTFSYGAALWTDNNVFNAGAPNLDNTEAKLAGYMTLPFTQVRLGMVDGNATRWIVAPVKANSMLDLMKAGFTATSLGRNTWKSLLASPSLQPYCNLEGFNAVCGGDTKCRIGIVSNQENDCGSCDSRIGFGCTGAYCGQDTNNSCGNEARCAADAGDRSVKTFGYIMIR